MIPGPTMENLPYGQYFPYIYEDIPSSKISESIVSWRRFIYNGIQSNENQKIFCWPTLEELKIYKSSYMVDCCKALTL